MCQSVCPVFDQTGREADVARGKLALLSGLMESMFDDPEGVYQRLNKCLLCGSCAANCPSGVSVQEIFLKARAILAGTMGLSPAKRLILKGMLANPARFDRLVEWGARFQKIFTRPVNDIIGTSCARVMSPLIQDRHFRTLAAVPFHRQVPSLDRPAGKAGLFRHCPAAISPPFKNCWAIAWNVSTVANSTFWSPPAPPAHPPSMKCGPRWPTTAIAMPPPDWPGGPWISISSWSRKPSFNR
jgi:NAD-dependent dihydropyrimidine dehydrogenase PreA subunit